MGYQNMDIV